MSEGPLYITAEGLSRIKEELDHLINVKRLEISERLQRAIREGDLRENADYAYTKQEQGFIEGRIRELEDSLRRAEIIENNGPSNEVRVGSTVTIVDLEYDEEETYQIVGFLEADPGNGRISNESPIGSALLGRRKGQTVTVQTPAGESRFRITGID